MSVVIDQMHGMPWFTMKSPRSSVRAMEIN